MKLPSHGSVQGEIDALNRLMDLTVYNLPLQWELDRTLLDKIWNFYFTVTRYTTSRFVFVRSVRSAPS